MTLNPDQVPVGIPGVNMTADPTQVSSRFPGVDDTGGGGGAFSVDIGNGQVAILDHGQIPLWNPYNWSGLPMLGHPESRVLAPTFLLTLLFGEVVGIKLEIVLHLALGILGAHLLLRHLGVSRLGATTGGVLFMLNSAYPLHLTVGHVWALSFAYLPWAFLFYLKALDDLRYSQTSQNGQEHRDCTQQLGQLIAIVLFELIRL